MRSVGKFLAGDTASHDFLCIFHSCGPVEPSPECFGYEHSTACMVPGGAFVDFEPRALPSSLSMHFWSICVMLRLYNCLLITVNALDRLLMRRASATSCGSVPSIMNRRKGFAQVGSSSSSGTELSGRLVLVPSDGLADATYAGSVASSSSMTASGADAGILIDL